jgi:glycosyltransferase involved in cell wall biosynthesis
MKIAVLGPISTAGIAPYLVETQPGNFPIGVPGAPLMSALIGALLDRGHEVIAITSGGYEATPDSRPMTLKGNRFQFYCCPARKHAFRFSGGKCGRMFDFFLHERNDMRAVLEQNKPDVVHAHWTYEYALAAIDSGIPYLITSHDDPVAILKLCRDPYRLGRYLMARSVLRRATALSAVSGDLQTRLRRFTSSPIEVIPNPLSRRFLQQATRRSLSSKHVEYRFISVMNGWGYWKNASAALKAFARIRAKRKHVTYHMFGADFQRDGPVARWAAAKNLTDGVEFHGPIPHDRLVGELRKACAMLHPSRWEACPMGIAEAMALGVPIVGGRHSGGVAWMIGEGGLLVDISKPEEIADAALRLISDERLYARCAAAAVRRVQAFEPDLIAGQYEAAYARAIIQTAGGHIRQVARNA